MVICRYTFALLCALAALFVAPSLASAGATQSVVYCGNPLANPNCASGTNYDWDLPLSIVVERSLSQTGQYVWAGESNGGYGFLPGNQPIGGTIPPSGDRQIHPEYTHPAGEIDNYIRGLAHDPASDTLFIADSDNDRIVSYSRGNFDGAGNSPGQYPYDGSRGGSTGGINNPHGLAYNPVTGDLIATSTDFWEVDHMAFTPGNRVDAPPNGGPVLGSPVSFGSNGWSDEGTRPVDAAVDPSNGHTYVALTTGLDDSFDEIAEYDENYDQIGSLAVPQSAIWDHVVAVEIDSEARLIYVAMYKRILVYSLSTSNFLGELNFGYDPLADASLVAMDVDTISRALYVVTDEISPVGPTEAPVTGYTLDPPPSCNPQAVTMTPGSSRTIVPSCTDVDGGVMEYSVVGNPSAGSAANLSDRSAISYTAPASPATTTIPFRVRSVNGRTQTLQQPVTIANPPADLTPVVRESANLEPVSGEVQIKLPGSDKWIPLTQATLIPVGTIIDARAGKAQLTFANADGTTQDGIFWDGIFQVSQGSGQKPIVTLKLRDDLTNTPKARLTPGVAPANPFEAVIARKRGKKKNGLWGDAKGKYRTSGKGGTATVRGTRWYVANYQYGSLFKVQRGVVTIDPIRGKNFNLKAGKQFFIFYKRN